MTRYRAASACWAAAVLLCLAGPFLASAEDEPVMSSERVVFQLEQGDIEFGFYPEVAPVTAAHIFKLVTMGLYTGNHFFRVDKRFVAQTADCVSGRNIPLSEEQRKEAVKNVPLEVKKGVKHHEGIVSMARGGSPDSGGNSFFIMYGDAPHLDMQYGIFGKVTKGMEVLHKLEELPTRKEGIFVMPLERITIKATYWYRVSYPLELSTSSSKGCPQELDELKLRFNSQADELQRVRKKCLPA